MTHAPVSTDSATPEPAAVDLDPAALTPLGMTVSIDGVLVEGDRASLPVHDHGILVGDGAFETAKIVDGEVFAWDRHAARLQRTLAALGLGAHDLDALQAAIDLTVAEGVRRDPSVAQGRLRVTVTSGVGPLGSGRGGGRQRAVVIAAPAAPWPAVVGLVTAPWPRNERSPLAGAKTTSYAENVVAVEYAHARGAGEAVLGNLAGRLCEGTGSNIAVGVDGVLVTPPLSSGCLAGITRELLLEWAADEGAAVEERDLPLEVLQQAEDVVLMSSTRDVQRVHVLDGRALAGGAAGDAAIALFARRAARGNRP